MLVLFLTACIYPDRVTAVMQLRFLSQQQQQQQQQRAKFLRDGQIIKWLQKVT